MTTRQSPRQNRNTATFPRSGNSGPNLATLDQLRGLRRPRLMTPEARRHLVPQECNAC